MKLSNKERQQLIAQYESELRKLAFQTQNVQALIAQLEEGATATPPAKKKRGRPKKAASSAAPKRRGRPPKAKKEETQKPKRRGRPPKAKKADKPAKPKRRGRPPKKSTAKKTTPAKSKRRGRPPKKSTAKKSASKGKTRGYRLSEWDELILDTLAKRQKVSVFADFMDAATELRKAKKTDLDDQALYRRINQSLHKLANKRGSVIKVKHEGRGYGYALPEWRSGRGIKKEFK